MTIVDTSVWIEHLHRPHAELVRLLLRGDVLVHPFVVGELACGALRDRDEVLGSLEPLPRPTEATHDEVMDLVTRHNLYGRGLAWIDVHLIASALLSDARLLTEDRPLRIAWAHVRSRGGSRS